MINFLVSILSIFGMKDKDDAKFTNFKQLKKQFDLLAHTRKNILSATSGLTLDQLNKIPEGYNNNVIWNMGHCVVTSQLLIYGLSGTTMNASPEMIAKYRKGTAPTSPVTESEVIEIRNLLEKTMVQIERDYEAGIFGAFREYPTSFGATLDSVESAIQFNTVHEAMHYGYILAQKKKI